MTTTVGQHVGMKPGRVIERKAGYDPCLCCRRVAQAQRQKKEYQAEEDESLLRKGQQVQETQKPVARTT